MYGQVETTNWKMPFEILENFQKLDPISRIQECLDPFESLVMRLKMCVKLLYKLGKCIYLWMRVKRSRYPSLA
jgi:hypothetical protein